MRWLLLAALATASATGCTDVSGFRGAWHGTPESSSLVRVGLPAGSEALLQLDQVERDSVAGTLSLGGVAPLRPLSQLAADQLGEASLPDSPLRTYWNAVTLPDGDALAVISLYGGDERVDLRLVRSDTLYVVFHLSRK
jgi:hypothetical protein